ncbi:hypothetical protein ABK040_010930 [Willaertia magna]
MLRQHNTTAFPYSKEMHLDASNRRKEKALETIKDKTDLKVMVNKTLELYSDYTSPLDCVQKLNELSMKVCSIAYYKNGEQVNGNKLYTSNFIEEFKNLVKEVKEMEIISPTISVFYFLSLFKERCEDINSDNEEDLKLQFNKAALHCNVWYFAHRNSDIHNSLLAIILLYTLLMETRLLMKRSKKFVVYTEEHFSQLMLHCLKLFIEVHVVSKFFKIKYLVTCDKENYDLDKYPVFPLSEFTECCLFVVNSHNNNTIANAALLTTIQILEDIKDFITDKMVTYHASCLAKCYETLISKFGETVTKDQKEQWNLKLKDCYSELSILYDTVESDCESDCENKLS